MNSKIYDDVANFYQMLKRSKLSYAKSIEVIQAKISTVDSIMTDIEEILSDNGYHIYEHFKEENESNFEENE